MGVYSYRLYSKKHLKNVRFCRVGIGTNAVFRLILDGEYKNSSKNCIFQAVKWAFVYILFLSIALHIIAIIWIFILLLLLGYVDLSIILHLL